MTPKTSVLVLALASMVGGTGVPLPVYALQPVQAIFEEDLSPHFAQLGVGMSAIEVLAVMKREPNRREVSAHLGLEIQRLVWTQWNTGNSFQVILVAGRMVSKASEKKTWIG